MQSDIMTTKPTRGGAIESAETNQNNILRHKLSGELLRLVTERPSGVNTYIQVDANGTPILERRPWSFRREYQLRVIKGYDNLTIQ